jgi:hypothetical protein
VPLLLRRRGQGAICLGLRHGFNQGMVEMFLRAFSLLPQCGKSLFSGCDIEGAGTQGLGNSALGGAHRFHPLLHLRRAGG